MGCTGSLPTQGQSKHVITKRQVEYIKTRETRIIQEDEVDVFINDEYDVVNKDWVDLHGTFLADRIETIELKGEWKSGHSAGGSRNDLELFSTNPQYLLILGPLDKHPKNDEFYLPNRNFTGIDVSLCLTQINASSPPLHVAFFVYRTNNMKERLTAEFFLCMPPEGDTGAFVNWRQVHQRFRMPPGLYIIIPAVFLPDQEGEFTLTVKAPPPVALQQFPTSRRESTVSSLSLSTNNSPEQLGNV